MVVSGGLVLRYCAYFFILFTLALPVTYAAQLTVKVSGISGQLLDNVNARLASINQQNLTDSGRTRSQIDEEVRQGLRALGYYNPTVSFEFQYKRPPAASVLVVYVDKGVPILIAGSQVNLSGEGVQDRDYQKILAGEQAKVGDVLNHGVYESFKSSLNRVALAKGYFDATMSRHELAIAQQLQQGFWRIDFDTGQRYRFGQVTFNSSHIDEAYLRNIIPFAEGDYYTSEGLANLNQRLSATGWFNSIVVSPEFDQVGDDKALPLEVKTTPRRKNTIDLGLGYSTDIGTRGTASWQRPWLNKQGHSIQVSSKLSSPEQSLDVNYRIPLLVSPLEQYYLLQAGVKNQNDQDTKAQSYSMNIARYWDLPTGWQRSVNLRLSYDDFTQGDDENSTYLLYPGINFTRIRQQGGLMPHWGDSQRYSLDYSNQMWGSDIDFAVFQARNVWIRSVAESHRFIFRGSFGWIETARFDKVPPSLRFFAGGDRSIRGYGYQRISPKDANGKLTGASRLILGSAEYQYNVSGSLWGAAFVDTGEAVQSFQQHDFKTGAGIGVRWASPFGPVKFDVAMPVNGDTRSPHFYIGIGAEL